jgi:hypothetical protein
MWVTSGLTFRNELEGEYQELLVTAVTLSGEELVSSPLGLFFEFGVQNHHNPGLNHAGFGAFPA